MINEKTLKGNSNNRPKLKQYILPQALHNTCFENILLQMKFEKRNEKFIIGFIISRIN